MKRKKWKKAALVLALSVIASVGMSGCKIGKTEVIMTSGFSKDEVFRIENKKCSLPAVRVFLTNYQNLYGTVYGVDLWKHDFGDNSLEQYIKDLTISQLAQIMSMDILAEEQQISLTEEELSSVKKAAKSYYDSLNKKEIQYMDVDEGCITELYRQYGLANKLYTQLTTGINDEVSDDEARVMEALVIFVTSKESADAVAAGLKGGNDFLTLAGTYNEASEAEVTFGRGDMPPEVEKVAFSLEPEAVSKVIQTNDGYYFIKCINNYNQQLTDDNKQVILERRRKEAFDDVYEEFIATLPSDMNEELWAGITVEENEEITTDSFFEVYEEYCKW